MVFENILRRDNDSGSCVRIYVDENKNNNDGDDEDEESIQNNSESSDEWEYLKMFEVWLIWLIRLWMESIFVNNTLHFLDLIPPILREQKHPEGVCEGDDHQIC